MTRNPCTMIGRSFSRAAALGVTLATAGLAATPAVALEMEWVVVGAPGNSCDPQGYPPGSCFGSVASEFRIGRFEVTNAQYAEFLNAVAATDDGPNRLYNPEMHIARSGARGSYTYAAVAEWANTPIGYVSFYDAIRFANWLHHGQPVGAQGPGTTEDGAYTITAQGIDDNTILRNGGATVFLPSQDEWYKAAYYAVGGWVDYPAGVDTPTTCAAPGPTPNTANCFGAVGHVTDVGAYTGSPGPFGTFDQGGNVEEWNDSILLGGNLRGMRGGSGGGQAYRMASSFWNGALPNGNESSAIGFRVAAIAAAPMDSDGDGVPDTVDVCPYAPDPEQSDAGGIGGGAPDGIGDACQCGDVTGDGRVTLADAVTLQRALLTPPTATMAQPDRCDVGGSSGCSLADAVIVRRALLSPPAATVLQSCAPALP